MTAQDVTTGATPLRLSSSALCVAVAERLRHHADALDEEQSPYGLDAPDELDLHPLIREGLASLECCALAEERYPSARATRRRSAGDRCDIALIEAPGEGVADPLVEPALFDDGRRVDAGDAMWIEVKIVRQFGLIDGVARPNRAYASQLLTSATADVRKLQRDESVRSAAMLLVIFTASEDAAEHDLDVWCGRCLAKNLTIESPARRSFAIADRIGNTACTIAVSIVR